MQISQKHRNWSELKFNTLHEGIRLIHASISESQRIRYKLKDANNMSMSLFQCNQSGCPSRIVFKAFNNNSSGKLYFQIVQYKDVHNHMTSKIKFSISHQKINKIMQQRQNSINYQRIMSNYFQFIKTQLRYIHLLNEYRDFMCNFTVLIQNKVDNKSVSSPILNIPYELPAIVRNQKISPIFRLSYKLINQSKKLYLFFIQVWILDQLVTQLKYLACLKQNKSQEYLYMIFLIYLFGNCVKNSIVQMNNQLYEKVNQMKENKNKNNQFWHTVDKVYLNYLNVQTQAEKKVKKQQKYNKIQVQILDDGIQQSQFDRNKLNLHQNQQKLTLIIKRIDPRSYKYIKQKLSICQNKYQQFINHKKPNDNIHQQKPSNIRNFNILMNREQKRRIKVIKNKIQRSKNEQFSDQRCIILDDQIQQQNYENKQKILKYKIKRNQQYIKQKILSMQLQGDKQLQESNTKVSLKRLNIPQDQNDQVQVIQKTYKKIKPIQLIQQQQIIMIPSNLSNILSNRQNKGQGKSIDEVAIKQIIDNKQSQNQHQGQEPIQIQQ